MCHRGGGEGRKREREREREGTDTKEIAQKKQKLRKKKAIPPDCLVLKRKQNLNKNRLSVHTNSKTKC